MSEVDYKAKFYELIDKMEGLIGVRRPGPWIEDMITDVMADINEPKVAKKTRRKRTKEAVTKTLD